MIDFSKLDVSPENVWSIRIVFKNGAPNNHEEIIFKDEKEAKRIFENILEEWKNEPNELINITDHFGLRLEFDPSDLSRLQIINWGDYALRQRIFQKLLRKAAFDTEFNMLQTIPMSQGNA